MLVRVNDQWQVKIDSYGNHQLVQFKEGGIVSRGKYRGQETEDRWVELPEYYSNMNSALLAIVKKRLLDENEELTLNEYCNKLQTLLNEFKNINFNLEG